MNKERLGKLYEVVTQNRDHFNMEYWVQNDDGSQWSSVSAIPETLVPECGTRMCLAGWACYLWKAETTRYEDIAGAAARILDLRYVDADDLFSAHQSDDEALEMLHEWSQQ